ncbi:MAG: ParB/RepB/Spo0J family partition protein [Caldilineaceae bacterium]
MPVIIREASSQQLVEWALVENIQRADLNPLEEGAAFQTLIAEFGLTHGEVADRVGKSRSTITNTVRLLQAPLSVQKAVTEKTISAGHARALLALEDDVQIEEGLKTVLSQGLNVRQTEALVKAWQSAAAPAETVDDDAVESTAAPSSPEQAQITYMEDRFRTALGTRVSLNRQQDGTGRLVIHFYSDDDLELIYRLIAGEDDEQRIE